MSDKLNLGPFTITEEILRNAVRDNCIHCPFALAIAQGLPKGWGHYATHTERTYIYLPGLLNTQVVNHDRGVVWAIQSYDQDETTLKAGTQFEIKDSMMVLI